MSQPYVGEIRIFGGNFAPVGWAFCDGSVLSIADSEVLFTLIGTTYGGDGQSTFALPDLRGRFPVHMGSALGQTTTIGEAGGVESVTLTQNQMPVHAHTQTGASAATSQSPANTVPAAWTDAQYSSAAPTAGVTLAPAAVGVTGGSQPHENRSPYLALSFIIALQGIFPSQA